MVGMQRNRCFERSRFLIFCCRIWFNIFSLAEFRRFVSTMALEVVEYLFSERGMTLKFFLEGTDLLSCDDLNMILRLIGPKGIREIPQDLICKYAMEVKLLKKCGYAFNISNEEAGEELHAMLCVGVVKKDELNEDQWTRLKDYVQKNDTKFCPSTVPFMRKTRQKKILTVILCIRSGIQRPVPKEIVWMILDYCYSPKREIG